MSVVRRFLVVPTLARLIRKERGGSKISEGYFAPQGGRTSLVRIDGQQCHLILINPGAGGAASEERTEVPRAHGDALLDVCSGKATYERTTIALSPGRDAMIDRYTTPAGLDLISVAFDDENASKSFLQPSWFGPEVTDNAAYERHTIAIQGVPDAERPGLTNAMLDAVLDLLEPRFGIGRFGSTASPQRPAEPSPAKVAPEPVTAPTVTSVAKPVAEPEKANEQANAGKVDEAELLKASAPEEKGSAPEAKAEAPTESASSSEAPKGDARIDDVIESLSQALGAAVQQPKEPARNSDDLAASFERWTVRPRRTQQ